MKLRIQGSNLRLRLTQAEVQQIGEGKPVREVTRIGGENPAFSYSLVVHTDQLPVMVAYQNHEMKVGISEQVAHQWATTDQIGIEERILSDDKFWLHILIEKDFRCLHRNVEDEPDQFPNPNSHE